MSATMLLSAFGLVVSGAPRWVVAIAVVIALLMVLAEGHDRRELDDDRRTFAAAFWTLQQRKLRPERKRCGSRVRRRSHSRRR